MTCSCKMCDTLDNKVLKTKTDATQEAGVRGVRE